MNKSTMDAAIKKHGSLYKEGKSKEDIVTALMDDVFTEKEAEEIYAVMASAGPVTQKTEAPKKSPVSHSDKYSNFDLFSVRIKKREVMNAIANKKEVLIVGWTLEKKLHPRRIEPNVALSLNAFADGFDTNGVGEMYFLEGTKTTGDFVMFDEWATAQGKNLKTEISHLLKDN